MSHEMAKGLRFFFWMRWVFVAACGFSLAVVNRGYSTAEVHRLLLLQSLSPRTCRLQELWQAGSIVVAHGLHYSVTWQHVGSSQTRDRTCVSCIGRQILKHWTTREVPGVKTENSHQKVLKQSKKGQKWGGKRPDGEERVAWRKSQNISSLDPAAAWTEPLLA